jgi:hypothetical protein
VFSLNSILISCGDTAPAPIAKPKESPKPKPKPEVKVVELTGKVEKMETEKGNQIVYHLKNLENKLVVLSNNVGDKEVDLEQFVGKEVIIKAKAEVTLKKSASGEEFKSVHLIQMHSIELKVAGAEKIDNPVEIKSEKPTEKLDKPIEIKKDSKSK